MANYDPVRQEDNSRPAPAGVMVTVGDRIAVGVMAKVGENPGVSVGKGGPMIGSVASGVGVDGGSFGRGVSGAVGSSTGVKVGSGAGVGAGRAGMATITRLNTMLAAMSRLTSHIIFWLRLCLWRLRLLTKLNLLGICLCDYTTSWQTIPGRCHALSLRSQQFLVLPQVQPRPGKDVQIDAAMFVKKNTFRL